MTMRKINSTFCSLMLKWMVFLPLPLLCEFKHHVFSSGIPNTIRFVRVSSVPLLFRSRSQKWPMTARKSASIIHNFVSTTFQCFFTSFFSPYNVVEHWHEDDRWSCLWTALDHTFVISWILESVRGGQMLWILGIFSTRTPLILHQYDSNLSNDYSQKPFNFLS